MNRIVKLDATRSFNQQAFAIDSDNPQDESRFFIFRDFGRRRFAGVKWRDDARRQRRGGETAFCLDLCGNGIRR